MTILQSLTRQYERMLDAGEVPVAGYSYEKIGWALEIDTDGTPLDLAMLGAPDAKGKHQPRMLAVPSAVKRSSGIASNFLWDKTAYVLGVVKGEEKTEDGKRLFPTQGRRTADEHAAFIERHREALAGEVGDGLAALLAFLDTWQWDQFEARGWPVEALDQNIVFRLKGDAGFLHNRAAARKAWLDAGASTAAAAQCLVSGEDAPVARLHPSIRGVMGAQTAGASLVSFNLDSFVSYGKSQGDNAPVSEGTAFAYGAALNAMLAKGSPRATRLGDTTVAFWAEADTEAAAKTVEKGMLWGMDPGKSEKDDAETLRALMENAAKGRPLKAGTEGLDPATRIHLLGLSPNAARLSVRFWHVGTFAEFARNIVQHWEDLSLDPPAFKGDPAVWALLYEIAAQRKAENIPPLLGGALMRAILTGGTYPRSLLAAVLIRLRAGDDLNGPRAALIKACLTRDARLNPTETKREVPVALDRTEDNPGYLLGRLFAVLETAQRLALGKVNATIRDRFFSSASATPAGTFPTLLRNANPHLAKLRKGTGSGLGVWLEREIAEILDKMGTAMPTSLGIEDQGRFVIGYYHQRFSKRDDKPGDIAATDATPSTADDDGDDS